MTIAAIYDVPAPAKLNLYLHVVGRRADGMHLLESLMVLIDWCDTIHLEPRGDGLRLTVGQEIGGLVIGQKLDVPAAQRDDVMAFFAESRRRRDSYSNLE